MIRAYRMLAAKVPYPLHLGVTEAGTPFAGAIKSAVGIGSLLADGIGDTLRVSLTADPVKEVEVAWEILKALGLRERGPVMIACPSCGRDNVGVEKLAAVVEERLRDYPQAFEVAVMGCAVNGPGEAGDADFGIAGGRDVGFIYAHGRVLKKVSSDILIDELFHEIDRWIDDGMQRPKRLKMAKPAALAMAEASPDPARLASARPTDDRTAPSQLFLPTLRDAPADAEAVSHKLLVRGGYIRQVSAGVWTFLPLGWRVHQKVDADHPRGDGRDRRPGDADARPDAGRALGADRPRLHPELFRLQDRHGREYVLPMTHEETVTFHAREIQSYRQLPQMLYHFSIKERDEPRPRGGLLRVREFIMKDAYSFDRDEAGLDAQLPASTSGAYHRIFERCGLEVYAVAGRVRDDGRQRVDRLPRAVGLRREHARHVRERRLRRRPRDRARRPAGARVPRAARRARGGRDARA